MAGDEMDEAALLKELGISSLDELLVTTTDDKPKRKRRKSIDGKLGIPDDMLRSIASCRLRDGEVNLVTAELSKSGRVFSLHDIIAHRGGHTEMMDLFSSRNDKIIFAYFKVVCEDDHQAVIDKFIAIKYLPDEVPIMIRAQSGTFDGQIQNLMPHHLKVTVHNDFEKELSIENLQKSLMKHMGSDKPTKLDFGSGHVWDVATGKLDEEN